MPRLHHRPLWALLGCGALSLTFLVAACGLKSDPAPAADQLTLVSQKQQQRAERKAAKRTQFAQAAKAFVSRRLPPDTPRDGKALALPVEKYQQALDLAEAAPTRYSFLRGKAISRAQAKANAVLGNNDWANLGPGFKTGGRTKELLIDPSDPNIMYAVSATGGIFKSENAGDSWFATGDLASILTMNTIAMAPNNSAILYAGTGEKIGSRSVGVTETRGNGILLSTDAAASWTTLPATLDNRDFRFVNKLLVSSKNAQRIYAATDTGIMRSVDGGTTWTASFSIEIPDGNGCTELVALPSAGSSDLLLATCQFSDEGEEFNRGRILRNSAAEGASQWQQVFSAEGMGLTTLAVAPSDGNIVYGAAADNGLLNDDGSQALFAILRSEDAGQSWTPRVQVSDPTEDTVSRNNIFFNNADNFCVSEGDERNFVAAPIGGGGQGEYDNGIAVDPLDPNIIWVGGIDLHRSDDGGLTWGWASYWDRDAENPSYTHADHHAIIFHPDYDGQDNQIVYTTTDGGISRSDNARAAVVTDFDGRCQHAELGVRWTNLTRGYAAAQFNHGMVDPRDEAFFMGGTQDNGTPLGRASGGVDDWKEVSGGDGSWVAIDPVNTNIIFASATNGAIDKSVLGPDSDPIGDSGVGSFEPAVNGLGNDSFPFVTNFVMDPGNPQILWTAGNMIWKTSNQADSWEQASAPLNLSQDGQQSVSWAVSPHDGNLVLNGRANGVIVGTDQASTASANTQWQQVQASQGAITWIEFDPINPNVVYAAVGSFDVDHLLKSTDRGLSWSAIDRRGEVGGIPNIPVNAVAIDPDDNNRLFAGTDLGVYVTEDGGNNWVEANSGMAPVIVTRLQVVKRGSSKNLYAFTYGRGLFRTSLIPGGSPSPTPTPSPQPTASPTPSPSPEPSASPSPTATPTPSASPSPTPAATASPTPTPSATPTPEPTPESTVAGPAIATSVVAGASDVALFSLSLRNDEDETLRLNEVRFELNLSNISIESIQRIRLFSDADADGQVDTTAPAVATGSIDEDGLVEFSLPAGPSLATGESAAFVGLMDLN